MLLEPKLSFSVYMYYLVENTLPDRASNNGLNLYCE
jgi:hypothetical protein